MNRFGLGFDLLSFVLGFILASVFWWVINLSRPLFKQARDNMKTQRNTAKERGSVGMEDRYRKLIIRQAEGMHVAAPLFALSEIVQPPRLLAPPARIEPGSPQNEDIISQALPYLPAWPEMASIYQASSFSLARALSGGTHIAVLGQPGTGKTVALAHLALQVANRAPEVEHLHYAIPFLLHVADLDLPHTQKDLLHAVIEAVADKVSVFDLSRTPKFVHSAFEEGKALLILDGVDELAPDTHKHAAEYVKALLKAFPRTRVVITCTTDFIDGFFNLGFAPLVVLPWNVNDQNILLARWAELWDKYVSNEAWAQSTLQMVDTVLLSQWLKADTTLMTPLEYTLKVWGIFAGDIQGPRPIDAIATHIRRVTPHGTPIDALQALGLQATLGTSAVFNSNTAREWVKAFEPAEEVATQEEPVPAQSETLPVAEGIPTEMATDSPTDTVPVPTKEVPAAKPQKKKSAEKSAAPKAGLVNKLVESGLLIHHRENRIRFSHPVFGGYLAGMSISPSNANEALVNQPAWVGRSLTFNYFASHADATALIDKLLQVEDEILQRSFFAVARLLRDAPRDAAWRGTIMASLINLMQQTERPLPQRGQATAAIVLCGDPSAASLFRQLTQLPSPETRQLAILGSGALRDAKAVDLILPFVNDMYAAVRRAACLALVAIGSPKALEAVAGLLMNGDEDQRRTAAEALANHPTAGHATLQEGSSAEDILLRRAVVFGLARIDEPWALQILEKIQLEDQQWVVRNAAVETLEARKRPSASMPKKLPPPHEAPWLIQFAGQFGMGVAPGPVATDMLLRAIKSNSEEERLAALTYLRYTPTEGVISQLYSAYFGSDTELRDAIFIVLWEMSLSGVRIPSPHQFGLG